VEAAADDMNGPLVIAARQLGLKVTR